MELLGKKYEVPETNRTASREKNDRIRGPTLVPKVYTDFETDPIRIITIDFKDLWTKTGKPFAPHRGPSWGGCGPPTARL